MTELVIYRGLPASGKTTRARHWVAKDPAHRARVNRDDLRQMFHAGVYLGDETEEQIRQARDGIIARLLVAGISVASDDTNLANQVVRDLSSLARGAGATARVSDLTGVDVEDCVLRDRARADGVGETVIREMHERYLKAPPPIPRF